MKKVIKSRKSLKKIGIVSYLLSAILLISGCSYSKVDDAVIDFKSINNVNQTKTFDDESHNESINPGIIEEIVEENNISMESTLVVDEDVMVDAGIDSEVVELPISEEVVPEEEVVEKKLVALTFDDGPSSYTSELIDILNENGAHATFFVVGNRLFMTDAYSNAVIKAYENGNEIANHTYNHKNLKKLDYDDITNEIQLTYDTIRELNIEPTYLVRAPGGNITSEIMEVVPEVFINWSVDSEDWKSRNVESIKTEIKNQIDENGIILCHDLYSTTVDAMRELLPELSEEYEFVTVSELFRRNGVELESGLQYRKVKTK